MNWIIARLKEPSSWRGIVWLLTFAGVTLEPAQAEAIITAGIALAGVLGVFTRDVQRTELPPIELQAQPDSTHDRRMADPDSGLDADRRMANAADGSSSRPAERMQSSVSSAGEPISIRSKPNFFTEGFNDR